MHPTVDALWEHCEVCRGCDRGTAPCAVGERLHAAAVEAIGGEPCPGCGGPLGNNAECRRCDKPSIQFREEDLGGVLGADGNVYSDADPGL